MEKREDQIRISNNQFTGVGNLAIGSGSRIVVKGDVSVSEVGVTPEMRAALEGLSAAIERMDSHHEPETKKVLTTDLASLKTELQKPQADKPAVMKLLARMGTVAKTLSSVAGAVSVLRALVGL